MEIQWLALRNAVSSLRSLVKIWYLKGNINLPKEKKKREHLATNQECKINNGCMIRSNATQVSS